MRTLLPLWLGGLLLVALPAAAPAQTDTATLNASLSGAARISLSSSSLAFPDADPDTVPIITGSPPVITITAKARATQGGSVVLTVQASDDLRSGLDVIPASAITWTATGSGFAGGTLSATVPRVVGSWAGSGIRNGTQTFYFQNAWTYATGVYTLSLLFTLSAA